MPSFVKAKGSSGSSRAPPPVVTTPMSERQQMALLMQMTSAEAGSRSPSGSRPRDRNERGETPLHLAAIRGDVEQVCRLLAHRADPNVTDFAGWTPLHEACNHGWFEVAFRLVQAGANVNAKGLDNETPLHDAAINGHMKLVKLLVERGADIHAKNSLGKTPLDIAAPSVVQLLLDPTLPISESSAPSSRLQARSRDEKKVTGAGATEAAASAAEKPQKSDDSGAGGTTNAGSRGVTGMDSKSDGADVYDFKSMKESAPSPERGKDQSETDNDGITGGDSLNVSASQTDDSKRTFSDMSESVDDTGNEDEIRRKKRKEDTKDGKSSTQQRNTGQNKSQSSKGGSGGSGSGKAGGGSSGTGKAGCADRKSPVDSPKAPANGSSDPETDEGKSDLKVPPLKIVIPQSTVSEQESGQCRHGKSSSQRSHPALPYVVPSSSEGEKEPATSGNCSPTDGAAKGDDKKDGNGSSGADDQRSSGHHQRVLRSSHRGGPQSSADRSSNNSSPQLQRSHSPSPSASPAAPTTNSTTATNPPDTPTSSIVSTPTTTPSASVSKTSDTAPIPSTSTANMDTEMPSASTNTTSTATTGGTSTSSSSSGTTTVELHPRKRKMKPSNKDPPPATQAESTETPAVSEVHPHEQPITNCYQLFLNIRRQIAKRRRGLFPVEPKPPQGFKDYLMNKCTYVLAGRLPTTPNITYPATLPPTMKDLFAEQEKERYKLRMQHVIEKEKLVLSVEQEILRVHGRAARALANQSMPFSVCTILQDEEVYNLITPEQEEKDRNARSRYNGRLFLGWLQDVDDKWEKIKEAMLLRHHNEADSLYAVQKMDWGWKMKELSLCDAKSVPTIEDLHVPLVHVGDDFDLLPA